MIRVRGLKFRDADDAHDERVQRQLDDEAEAKRAASGMSSELLRLSTAAWLGSQAGANGVAAGCNEYDIGTPEAEAWERARSTVEAMRRADELKRRAKRTPCSPCTCGGRGLCRDNG